MSIQKPQFKLASDLESEKYTEAARTWFNSQRGHEYFDAVPSVAIRVITEYIANQNRQTIFKGKADLD